MSMKKKPTRKSPSRKTTPAGAPPTPATMTAVSRQVHDELLTVDGAWGRIQQIAVAELARLRHGGAQV